MNHKKVVNHKGSRLRERGTRISPVGFPPRDGGSMQSIKTLVCGVRAESFSLFWSKLAFSIWWALCLQNNVYL